MENKRLQTRFHARTELERQFLAIVNDRCGNHEVLTGMTRAAIESWRLRAQVSGLPVERIASLLLEAAGRAELLADDSREVFEKDILSKVDSIGELKRELEHVLA